MGLPTVEAAQDLRLVSVWIDSGSTALSEGDVLAYVEDASTSADDLNTRLGRQVEIPTSDSINFIAGVVGASDAGKTGKNYLTLIRPQPGDVVKALVNGDTDVSVGDLLEYDVTKGALISATAADGDVLFRALEATTTDDKKLLHVYKV